MAAGVPPSHTELLGRALRDGRYVISGVIGGGTQGATVEAVDKRDGRLVAIKRFQVRGARSWKDVELAEREPEVLRLINRALVRSLRLRFLAGVFEDPYGDAERAEQLNGNLKARRLAQRAAERAIILLKNEGDLLPLDRSRLSSLAVIGPNAGETILGGYSAAPKQTVSILDGIRSVVGADIEVHFAQGVHITVGRCRHFQGQFLSQCPWPCLSSLSSQPQT